MKYQKLIIALYIVFFMASLSACAKNKDWAVKIDGEVMSMDEFNSFYYTQNRLLLNKTKKEIDKMANDESLKDHPSLNKKNFLDFLIGRKLLYNKAYNDESVNKKNLDIVDELYNLQGISNYYMAIKLQDELDVSDDEINSFYQANRKLFMGIPMNDEVIEKIKQQIKLKKYEKISTEFVMELLAESKVTRDGFQKYMSQQDKASSENSKEKAEKEMDSNMVLIEIDDDKLTLSKFLDFYYIQNKIVMNMDKDEIDKVNKNSSMTDHPTLNKNNFMDFIISKKLVYKKAMADESLDKKELKSITELFKIQGISSYYLFLKLADKINVTDNEINKFYRDNKQMFRGIPFNDQVKLRIQQQIYMQKFEGLSSQFILGLLAESKVNREGFRNYMKKKEEEEKKAQENKKDTKEQEKK